MLADYRGTTRHRATSMDAKRKSRPEFNATYHRNWDSATELDMPAEVFTRESPLTVLPAAQVHSGTSASPTAHRSKSISPSFESSVARSYAEKQQMDAIERGEKSSGGKFRQLPCRTYIASGFCPYKDRCVYLHCPSIRAPYECKFKNKRKNKEDIVADSLFWPIMPYASETVESEYTVPLPQSDQYELHDRSLISVWSYYTQTCQRLQTEFNINSLTGFEHAKARRELAEANNATNPANAITKRNRLGVFHSMSNGVAFNNSAIALSGPGLAASAKAPAELSGDTTTTATTTQHGRSPSPLLLSAKSQPFTPERLKIPTLDFSSPVHRTVDADQNARKYYRSPVSVAEASVMLSPFYSDEEDFKSSSSSSSFNGYSPPAPPPSRSLVKHDAADDNISILPWRSRVIDVHAPPKVVGLLSSVNNAAQVQRVMKVNAVLKNLAVATSSAHTHFESINATSVPLSPPLSIVGAAQQQQQFSATNIADYRKELCDASFKAQYPATAAGIAASTPGRQPKPILGSAAISTSTGKDKDEDADFCSGDWGMDHTATCTAATTAGGGLSHMDLRYLEDDDQAEQEMLSIQEMSRQLMSPLPEKEKQKQMHFKPILFGGEERIPEGDEDCLGSETSFGKFPSNSPRFALTRSPTISSSLNACQDLPHLI